MRTFSVRYVVMRHAAEWILGQDVDTVSAGGLSNVLNGR